MESSKGQEKEPRTLKDVIKDMHKTMFSELNLSDEQLEEGASLVAAIVQEYLDQPMPEDVSKVVSAQLRGIYLPEETAERQQ